APAAGLRGLGAARGADPGQGDHADAQLRRRADALPLAAACRRRRPHRPAHRRQGPEPGRGGCHGAGRRACRAFRHRLGRGAGGVLGPLPDPGMARPALLVVHDHDASPGSARRRLRPRTAALTAALRDHVHRGRHIAGGELRGAAVGADRAPGGHAMTEVASLSDAVAEIVHDGDAVAIEGFTHLIPFAAGHEILRQERRGLELIRMTPDILYDQMIGMGAARKLVFSYGGNRGINSLHRFRDAVEHEWPHAIELEEHSHAGMANRYAAGAARMPFAVMRGYVGTDLAPRTQVKPITCPFTGEELVAVPALRPDVAIVHAQEADREGNVQLWGIPGVQKEAVLAADRALVTVERIVDELKPRPGGVVIPSWVIDAVAEAP